MVHCDSKILLEHFSLRRSSFPTESLLSGESCKIPKKRPVTFATLAEFPEDQGEDLPLHTTDPAFRCRGARNAADPGFKCPRFHGWDYEASSTQ